MSFNELYCQNNPSAIGNSDLKPEKMKTSEILAGINLTEHITATLDFFHIQKKDAIVLYRGFYANHGEIESDGTEGEIKVFFHKNRYAYCNVTFQKAKDVSHEIINDIGGTAYISVDMNNLALPFFISWQIEETLILFIQNNH